MKTKNTIGILSLLAVSALVGCDSGTTTTSQKSYLLVHGAWMGAWCWNDVVDGLRSQGAAVTTDRVAGTHGSDQTPLPQASLDAYITKRTCSRRRGTRFPVILVGHSLGGMVITGVAEVDGAKLAKIVYLGAYLPKDGQSLYDLASTDATSHLGPALVVDQQDGLAKLPSDSLADIFIADGTTDEIASVVSNYRDEPLVPFVTPVHTTAAGWGVVPKAYIYTKDDHAVSSTLQHTMTAGVTMSSTITLDTSHAPFLSRPDLVVSALASM